MDNTQLDTFFASVDAQATPDLKIATLKSAVSDLAANVLQAQGDSLSKDETIKNLQAQVDAGAGSAKQITDLQNKYTALEQESNDEISRLSKELSFATTEAGKATLSVTVNGKRYTTPAGRVYTIAGNPVKVEDIVKDDALVAKLIGIGSSIFTLSADPSAA